MVASLLLSKDLDKQMKAIKQMPGSVANVVQVNIDVIEKDILPGSISLLHTELGISVTDSGQPIPNIANVLRVLEGCQCFKDRIWYDEFHQKIFTNLRTGSAREWSDAETISLTIFMQNNIGFLRIGKEAVFDAVLAYGRLHTRNEPKDWMESLIWDKTPRIERFFNDCLGADENDYTKAASKNFLIAVVARIYSPGSKVDTMPVFEGVQGSLKSTALENLVGKNLYCDAHESVTSKDFFQILPGKLIVEIAELDAFSRAEVTRIKQVITCKVDRYRASYGRLAEDHPRMSVFVGTTNEESYLKDNTGARRFWPVKIGKINIPRIQSDREQLFAEAVHLYKSGASWWEMPETAAAEQESRRQADDWEEVIAKYLVGRLETSTMEVAKDCLYFNPKEIGRAEQMRVARCLKVLGWTKHDAWRDGKVLKKWFPKDDASLQPSAWEEKGGEL